ncbi:MAG: AI-2E family transporter [Caldimonas sp.]
MLAFDRRAARITWTVFLVAMALVAVYAVRRTLLVFFFAIFFSYMVFPLVKRIEPMIPLRPARLVATTLVFVLFAIAVAVLLAVIGPPLANQASRLAARIPQVLSDPGMFDRVPLPDWLAPYRERMAEFVREHLPDSGSAVPIAKRVGQTALRLFGDMLYLVLIPILAFLFITNGASMRDAFLGWTAEGRHLSMWSNIVADLDRLFGRYIRALVLLSAATFVSYSIFFTVAHVPYGIVLAAVGAALEFIPVIGPLVAAVVALVVAAVGGYDHLLVILVFVGLYRLFQDYVLNPALMSGGVAVPPLLVLFGLLAGEEIGGVVGIFLSIPVLAAARIAILRIREDMHARADAEARATSAGSG